MFRAQDALQGLAGRTMLGLGFRKSAKGPQHACEVIAVGESVRMFRPQDALEGVMDRTMLGLRFLEPSQRFEDQS